MNCIGCPKQQKSCPLHSVVYDTMPCNTIQWYNELLFSVHTCHLFDVQPQLSARGDTIDCSVHAPKVEWKLDCAAGLEVWTATVGQTGLPLPICQETVPAIEISEQHLGDVGAIRRTAFVCATFGAIIPQFMERMFKVGVQFHLAIAAIPIAYICHTIAWFVTRWTIPMYPTRMNLF